MQAQFKSRSPRPLTAHETCPCEWRRCLATMGVLG